MNSLIVGSDKSDISTLLPPRFLLIDDGPLIDSLDFPPTWKVTHLDISEHVLNPLSGIDYRRARDFVSVLDAVFPEGDSTLTKKASRFALLSALLEKRKRTPSLESLITPDKNDPGSMDAHQRIQTLLLSPVLKALLTTNRTKLSLKGIVLARLDRSQLSEFDCFVIANLLISRYQGQVVIPDFGFYGCDIHTSLIRQNRLIAGVNFLDEVSKEMQNRLMLMDKIVPKGCTAKDADTLADYCCEFPRGTDGFDTYRTLAMQV
jgi:hypothetical protein